VKRAPLTVAASLYQTLLHLYPSSFHDQFGRDMAADFEDATEDAWQAHGWLGVLRLWPHLGTDLIRGVLLQWLRTVLPAVLALSATWSTVMFAIVAHQYVKLEPRLLPIRPAPASEALLLAPLAIVLLFTLIMQIHAWLRLLTSQSDSSEC
jgi:hypothetical protein